MYDRLNKSEILSSHLKPIFVIPDASFDKKVVTSWNTPNSVLYIDNCFCVP